MVSFVVCGKRKHGKTTFIKNYLIRNLPNSKKYIFDIQNDYSDIKNAYCDKSGNKEQFLKVVENVKNSVIVFEESTAFFNSRGSEMVLRKILVSSSPSHNNNILFFAFHSLRFVPSYLIDLCDYFVIFKTNDLPQAVRQKFGDTKIFNAWNNVRVNPDKYAHLFTEP